MKYITILFYLLWSTNLLALEQKPHSVIQKEINTLIINNNDKTQSAFFIRIDLSNDNSNLTDIAHLTEHLLFKGTHENPSFNAFTTYLTNNNIKSNGRTFNSYIDFHFIIDNNKLEDAIPRIVQQFTQPLFNASQIEKELRPFQEEVNGSLHKNSYKISKCLFNNKNIITRNIESLSSTQLSTEIQQWYKNIFTPDNISFMLWTSKSEQTLKTLLNNALSHYNFPDVTLSNKKINHPNHGHEKIYCSMSKNTNQGSVFELQFENKNFHMNMETQVFFTLLSLNNKQGSLLSELKKNTSFDSITHVSVDNTEIIQFSSNIPYTLADTVIAKRIFFSYLELLKENKLPNEVKNSLILHKVFPISKGYKYLTLQDQFNKNTKQWFNGEDLHQKLASIANFLLKSNPVWVIDERIKPSEKSNIENNESMISTLASLDIKLLDFTPNKSFIDYRTTNYKEIEFLSYPELSPIGDNLSIQTFKENSEIDLTSLLISIKSTSNNNSEIIDFNKIKSLFLERNKKYLELLKNNFIYIQLETSNGLAIRISSYTSTFSNLTNNFMNRLQETINEVTPLEMSAEFVLLGTVTKQIFHDISQQSKKYFSPTSNLNVRNIKSYSCSSNCINFPLTFISRRKAIIFTKLLIELSNQRLLNDIRFSQVISYDAKIALTFKKNHPELRIFASNNTIKIKDYLFDFLMMNNYKYIVDNNDEFNAAKDEILADLDKTISYKSTVEYYWEENVINGLPLRNIKNDIEQLKDMSFTEFIEIYNDFIRLHQKT